MELFDNLNEIKSQLFDAPADIKSAFNNVVRYFDSNRISRKKSPKTWYLIKVIWKETGEVLMDHVKGYQVGNGKVFHYRSGLGGYDNSIPFSGKKLKKGDIIKAPHGGHVIEILDTNVSPAF